MTEKRFHVEKQTFDGYCIVDNYFEGYYTYEKQDLEKLCENLNDLNDENEQLKSEYKVLHIQHQDLQKFVENNFDEHLTQQKLNRRIIKLSGENEKLKSEIEKLSYANEDLIGEKRIWKQMSDEYTKLSDENEQLKQFKEKVFVLLDEKIKHYEHKPFSAPVGQPMSVNFDADVDRLARLSELQDLEKELQE